MPPIAILVSLADPTRCRIIEILRDGPQPVHMLAGAFKISRPAISRHLRVLKQAKLISEKKAGRENRYALHAEKLKPVVAWVSEMRAGKVVGQGSGPVTDAPVDKAMPETRVLAKVATSSKPELTQEPLPVTEAVRLKAVPKLKAHASISQMGFDF